MKGSFRNRLARICPAGNCLAVSALMAGSSVGLAGTQSSVKEGSVSLDRAPIRRARGIESQTSLTVRIYNYARVSEQTLNGAVKQAQRVYRQAGIETEWTECATTLEGASKHASCPNSTKSSTVAVNILPRRMAEREGFASQVFGAAIPEAGIAKIFFHRVEKLARTSWRTVRVSVAAVLGHVMAHEVGHLLLGHNSHSLDGIMHVPWDQSRLIMALQGRLLFDSAQVKKIQNNVARRNRGLKTSSARPAADVR